MQVEHLAWNDNGVSIKIPRSEPAQKGPGREFWLGHGVYRQSCPILALQNWLGVSGIQSGSIFRRVDPHEKIGANLQSDMIGRIIKRLARRANLENPEAYGAPSLRTDFMPEADVNDANLGQIMVKTGHKLAAMTDSRMTGGSMDSGPLKGQLEALLLALGRPVTVQDLARGLEINEQEVESLLQQYESDHEARDKAIHIRRRANGIRMEVKREYVWAIEQVLPHLSATNLTDQELEALAVIAMTQPVKTADIDAICKRESARDVRALRDRKLVAPRAVPDPSQKDCWRTTQLFLDMFDIESVHSLHANVRSGNGDLSLAQLIDASVFQLRQLGLANRAVRTASRKSIDRRVG